MARVWFNKTYSNVRVVLELIRQGDAAGEFQKAAATPAAHRDHGAAQGVHRLLESGAPRGLRWTRARIKD
jgi:hypothetical protein